MKATTRMVTRQGKRVGVRDWYGNFAVVSRDHATESVQVPRLQFRWLRQAKRLAKRRAASMLNYYGQSAVFTIRVYDTDTTNVVFKLEHNRMKVATPE